MAILHLKTRTYYYLGSFLLALAVFFLYSIWTAPYSPNHGYIIGAAKFISRNYTPYLDISIKDTPLAIAIYSLLYSIVGITKNGDYAVFFLMLFHICNTYVLYNTLKTIGIKKKIRLLFLIFFFISLYATEYLVINIESISLFFLLLSLNFGVLENRSSKLLSIIFITLSIFSKAQAIITVPSFIILSSYNLSKKKLDRTKAFRLIIGIIISIITCSVVTYFFCNRVPFWEQISWCDSDVSLKTWMFRSATIALRCNLPLLILPLITKDRIHDIYLSCALFAFLLFEIMAVNDVKTVWFVFLIPFFTIAFADSINNFSAKRKYDSIIIYTLILIFPCIPFFKECRKFDWGAEKTEQKNTIEALNSLLKKPAKIAILCEVNYDQNLGPQIYAEIPDVIPVDLNTTKWGQNNWYQEKNESFVRKAINDADYIIMNDIFAFSKDAYCFLTGEKWNENLNNYFDTHNNISLGELIIIEKNNEDY